MFSSAGPGTAHAGYSLALFSIYNPLKTKKCPFASLSHSLHVKARVILPQHYLNSGGGGKSLKGNVAYISAALLKYPNGVEPSLLFTTPERVTMSAVSHTWSVVQSFRGSAKGCQSVVLPTQHFSSEQLQH